MNAGIAPGVTNLVAADLLERFPEADEVEIVFTVSSNNGAGAAGGRFAHRGLTGVSRHEARTIPLPQPFGARRCMGFAEADRGWIDDLAGERTVNTFVCLAERKAQSALMALNRTGLISKLPRAAFAGTRSGDDGGPTVEPVAHWIAVRDRGRRLAAKTVECKGDYVAAAQTAVVFLDALLRQDSAADAPWGVFSPEELLTLNELPGSPCGERDHRRESNTRARPPAPDRACRRYSMIRVRADAFRRSLRDHRYPPRACSFQRWSAIASIMEPL